MQTYCLLENHTKEVNCCAFSDEHFATCSGKQAAKVTVITFYSPSRLGQETAKGPFGLRVKLPPAHLSTTFCGGFILSL